MTGTDPKNLLGTTLSGRYRIEKAIGEGGMGAIFMATQLSLGRAVAIKVVKAVHDQGSDAMRRFELETEVIARLAHPNIVQVVDAGRSEDGTMFLAMELLEGDSVRGVLRKQGVLPVSRALAIVEDIASALSAAHAGGVIHRDLKAENVMLVRAAGKQEIAKVLDFGVAKLTTKTEAPPQTGSGFVAGTPGCIAPEQMMGKSDEPRSDLYSVGVLMFEMLAGEAPFVASSSVELMMRHLTEPAPRVADVARARGRPEVPAPVDELVASLLSKDPEGRPNSAEVLVDIVSSLRDASRSTQPDLRVPTPMGGFAVPTPGSVSLPTPRPIAGASAGEDAGSSPFSLPPPNAAPGGTPGRPITAPTTTVPAPLGVDSNPAMRPPQQGRPPLKKILRRIAAVVTLFIVLPTVWMIGREFYLDRAIPGFPPLEADSWEHWEDVDVQLLNLEVDQVKSNVKYVLQKHPDVPMAYLYLAQVAMLERQPLSIIDNYHRQAREAADARARALGSTRHTQLFVDALTEPDPERARDKWKLHLQNGGCADPIVERHMFAQRVTFTEIDGERMLAVWEPLARGDYFGGADFGAAYETGSQASGTSPSPSPSSPTSPTDHDDGFLLGHIGKARALRFLGRIEEARMLLEPIVAKHRFNPIVVSAMVDVDLARGQRDQAIARIDAVLKETPDPAAVGGLALRRAVIRFRDDPTALKPLEALYNTFPPSLPQKTLGLGYLGYAYASRGQLKEADALWRAALAAAAETDDPALYTAELAVFAALFGALINDSAVTDQWLAEYQEVQLGLKEGATARRLKALALGGRIVNAANKRMMNQATSVARDLAWLKAERTDVPLLTASISWHADIAMGNYDAAYASAATLPRCFREGHLGVAASLRNEFAEAGTHLAKATGEDIERECTGGDDIVAFIQAMHFAKALGFAAVGACMSVDRPAAEALMKRLHGHWPQASSPSEHPEWLMYVKLVENWLAGPGTQACDPTKVGESGRPPAPAPQPPPGQ